MKRYRQVTAIVLVLILILGTAVYAYPVPEDVEGTGHEEAMTTLAALGILKGRDTGEFDPAGSITRAEFAAVVIRALGLESSVQAAEYDPVDYFDDCGDNAWAWGYINLAFKQGIIEGYGERMFGPNDPVTYEQAVAMLVRILGYEKQAQEKGGWSIGYMKVAYENKMTDVLDWVSNEPAVRSAVAHLTFQALEIPLCDARGNITKKTLLYDKLGIEKKTIRIISTDEIAFEFETNQSGEFSYREILSDGSYSNIKTAKTEDPVVDSYVGRPVKGYFQYDKLTNQTTAVLLWPEEVNSENTDQLRYAYVLDMDSASDGSVTLRLLTQDGRFDWFPCADTVLTGDEQDTSAADLPQSILDNIIQYQINEQGYIDTVICAVDNTQGNEVLNTFSMDYDGTTEYRDGYLYGDASKQYQITDQTIIFEAPFMHIRGNEIFRDERFYSVKIYTFNNEVTAILFFSNTCIDVLNDLSVLDSIKQSKIRFYIAEEQIETEAEDPSVLTPMSDADIQKEILEKYGLDGSSDKKVKGKDYKQWFASYKAAYSYYPGNAFLYTMNDGNIQEMQKMFPLENPELIQWDENGKMQLTPFCDYKPVLTALTISCGTVTNKTEKDITISTLDSNEAGDTDEILLTIPLHQYGYVYLANQNGIQIKQNKDIEIGDFIVVSQSSGETLDIIIYRDYNLTIDMFYPEQDTESYSPVSIVAAERVADTKNSDGSTVQRVYGMKDGKQVQLLTKNDTILADKYSMKQIQQEVTKKTGLTPGSSETYNGATYEQWVMSYRAAYQYIPGSILLYTTNGYDEIRYAYKIFPANHPDYIQWDNGKSSIKPYVLLDDNFGMASEDRRRIITGTAANKVNDGILTFDAARVSGDFPMRVALSEFANVYTIDTGTGEAVIQNGSISQISKGDTVVVHEYDDEVKDIFIYRNFDLNRLLK